MKLETDKNVLGKKFRKFRKLKNMTQFELAEKVGLNEKQISRIEMGLNYPTYITFAKIVNVLDINIENFKNDNSEITKPFENQILYLLKDANEKELKIYYDVLTSIKNNINSLHLM